MVKLPYHLLSKNCKMAIFIFFSFSWQRESYGEIAVSFFQYLKSKRIRW